MARHVFLSSLAAQAYHEWEREISKNNAGSLNKSAQLVLESNAIWVLVGYYMEL